MTTPYAKALVSVNGGANTSGGIDVPSAAAIDLVPESTVGWKQAKWEFVDYPEGWATPAGWTLGADGTIYSTAFTPPQITLPANTVLWGVWMLRLRVNEQVSNDQVAVGSLLDTSTALSMLSPSGLRDIGAREGSHFTTAATRIKRWLRSYQRNLRAIEASGGGSVATDDGDAPQAAAQVDTSDATPTNIGDAIALATDTVTTVDVAVQAIQVGASKAKIFSVRRSFLNDGGAVTDGTQQDLITAEELGGALAASVDITRTGTTAQPKVTGVAATGLRWYLISQAMKVASLTGSVPAAPTAISPDNGTAAGGTAVQITVADSTGLTGAKVGGVALTGFTIDDATHVSGTTGAHAEGAVDVVVSNVFGDSAALAGGFTYTAAVFDPADLALTGWWRASYSASPWAGTASAGSSGTRNLTEATNPPSAGAALNGHTPADFDGTNDELDGVAGSNFYSVSAYSGAALIYLDAVDTNNAVATSPFLNDPIINSAATGDFGVSFRNSAGTITADVWHWTGAAYASASVVVTAATWLLLQWKLEAGNLYIRVNGGVWSTGAAANAASLTAVTRVGGNYDSSGFLDGKIAELMTANVALAGVDFEGIIEYVNDRYNLAL